MLISLGLTALALGVTGAVDRCVRPAPLRCRVRLAIGAASAPQSIAVEEIKAPTLVVSLEDDFYRTLAPARFIAAHVPGARLLTYASGGHVWVGHDAELFAEVDAFIGQHQPV